MSPHSGYVFSLSVTDVVTSFHVSVTLGGGNGSEPLVNVVSAQLAESSVAESLLFDGSWNVYLIFLQLPL